jgi:hypothetical protein
MDSTTLRLMLTWLAIGGGIWFIVVYLCLFLDHLRNEIEQEEEHTCRVIPVERARNERIQPEDIHGGDRDLFIYCCPVCHTGDTRLVDERGYCYCGRMYSRGSSCRILGSDRHQALRDVSTGHGASPEETSYPY